MNTTTPTAAVATAPSNLPPPSNGSGGPTSPNETARLAEPFPVEFLGWLPKVVKGNRALAIPFIDARMVQDRLDEVMGPGNWQDEYDIMPGGSVMCRLKLRVDGEWVAKVDVGSPSEQPDAGDKLKAAFSDAMKRAGVKWGIGRYLYDITPVWCDYDGAAKKFTQIPQLPAWARPKAITHDGRTGQALPERTAPQQQQQQQPATTAPAKQKLPPPKDGKELVGRLVQFEGEMVGAGRCKPRELITHVEQQCKQAGYGSNLLALQGESVQFACDVIKDFCKPTTAPAQQPPATAGRPNGASLTVREGVLATLRERMDALKREFNEDPDRYLSREVHNGLTMAWLEQRADLWGIDAIAQIAEQVDKYVKSGVPY